MVDKKDRFADCTVIGGAVKSLGEILRPYIKPGDSLLTVIDDFQGEEASGKYYPVQLLIDLLQVAADNGVLGRLAENRAIGTLGILMKQPGIQTPIDVLEFLGTTMGNHHLGDVGKLKINMLDSTSAEVVDSTYLPCGFTIPMLTKTLVGFGAKNVACTHKDEACRQHGARNCTMIFSWDESDLLKIRQR
jgi:hypothetical protein